jgi:hypothetical protein
MDNFGNYVFNFLKGIIGILPSLGRLWVCQMNVRL